jgi:signal transduction histidine kinase
MDDLFARRQYMNHAPAQTPDRILLITDQPAAAADFHRLLQPAAAPRPGLHAFELDPAATTAEALPRLQAALTADRPYALAVIDLRPVPGADALEAAAKCFQADPDLQIILCAAPAEYAREDIDARLGQSGRLAVLQKPFDPVELSHLAHTLAEKWALGRQLRALRNQLEDLVNTRTHQLQAANDQLKVEITERNLAEEVKAQAQKMEAVGRLADGLAHDFNNLITVIRGFVQCLKTEMHRNPAVTEALQEINEATERAAKLTAKMVMFSPQKQVRPQYIRLDEVVSQFGGMLIRMLGEDVTQIAAEYNQEHHTGMLMRSMGDDIDMEIQTGQDPLPVHADPVMIEKLVVNLALNARDAMPKGGRLLICTGHVEITEDDSRRNPRARPGRFAWLSVEDTGCGLAPEALAHLYEPYFTTKKTAVGAGLGLASAYGIVKQHDGWIEVESQPGRGSRFKVFLPEEAPKAAPAPSKAPIISEDLPTPVGGNETETILVVENDDSIRRLAKLWLQRKGYRIYEATSAAEALNAWAAHGANIDLLITDMFLSGALSGEELAEKLLAKKPGLKVIYSTGFTPEAFSGKLVLRDGINFLGKPYHPNKLVETVRRRLDTPA